MEDHKHIISSILACPKCHTKLDFNESSISYRCSTCHRIYKTHQGVPDFRFDYVKSNQLHLYNNFDYNHQKNQYFNNTSLSKIVRFTSSLISCDFTPSKQLNHFLAEIPDDAVVVEIGSGNRKLHQNCINIDIFQFPNVDILADGKIMPFFDEVIDYIVIDAVLEHVPEPNAVVNEIYRVLINGGKVFCVTPFIHPYHGYPNHYYNLSHDTLHYLFRNFTRCNIEVYRGPTSALLNLITEYFALALSKNARGTLYAMTRGFFLLPIFWLKYLDKFWSPQGNAMRISNALCSIVTK